MIAEMRVQRGEGHALGFITQVSIVVRMDEDPGLENGEGQVKGRAASVIVLWTWINSDEPTRTQN